MTNKTLDRLVEYPHVTGHIESGSKRGREMGVPTINLPLPEKFEVRLGVYASLIELDGQLYQGVTNAGAAKTFDSRDLKVETHVLQTIPKIESQEVTVYLVQYLREVKKFDSTDQLVSQILHDIADARAFFWDFQF